MAKGGDQLKVLLSDWDVIEPEKWSLSRASVKARSGGTRASTVGTDSVVITLHGFVLIRSVWASSSSTAVSEADRIVNCGWPPEPPFT